MLLITVLFSINYVFAEGYIFVDLHVDLCDICYLGLSEDPYNIRVIK